jgi:hypothetical protein
MKMCDKKTQFCKFCFKNCKIFPSMKHIGRIFIEYGQNLSRASQNSIAQSHSLHTYITQSGKENISQPNRIRSIAMLHT